jgi:hypothetical protein
MLHYQGSISGADTALRPALGLTMPPAQWIADIDVDKYNVLFLLSSLRERTN